MKQIVVLIRSRPITSFFVITFVVTWGLGFSYNAVLNREQMALIPVMALATCGPAVAGIICTAVGSDKQKAGSRGSQWIAFGVALILGTAVFAANMIVVEHNEISIGVLAAIAILFVSPVAWIISTAFSRRLALRKYLATLTRIRGVFWWAVLAALLVPALALLSVVIQSWFGGEPPGRSENATVGISLIGAIFVRFLYQLLFFNVVGEEIGWSGFARARLQQRFSPLVTGLVIALFWAPWHLFLWMAEGAQVVAVGFWLDAYLTVVPMSILIGWLYNRSNQSILVAGIAHAAGNTAMAFVPNVNLRAMSAVVAGACVIIILADQMWKRVPQNPIEDSGHGPVM